MHRVLLPLVVIPVLLSGCRPVQAPPGAAPMAAEVSKSGVDLAEPLPVDPDVRIGTLDNGLTYYIRENQEPQKRAELWLAVNAGSVLEDDDQKGLAHFLEHMLFNGTEEYPGAELVDFLESLGIQFGPDLNAYTSFDETVYQLQAPTDDGETLRTGLDVLKEWAGFATIDPAEVDAERGVIVEEWRQREETAGGRIRERLVPMLLAGSRYAERLPIGDMEVVRNAPPETLRRYYESWYRPDLMAVIAVGDFDAAAVEAQIREIFAELPAPATPAARPAVAMPDVDEDRYLVVTDPENTATTIQIMHRIAPQPEVVVGDLQNALIDQLVGAMLRNRYDELAQQAGSPILRAFAGRSQLVRTADTFTVAAQTPDDKLAEGAELVATELERARRHGFTDAELKRAASELLRSYQLLEQRRNDLDNATFVQQYLQHFLSQSSITSIPELNALVQQLAPAITVAMANERARMLLPASNRAVVVVAPEKEGLEVLSEAMLAALVEQVATAAIEPYADATLDRPLLETLPIPVEIVAERPLPGVGATEIELANGVRVIMKPTDFDATQILFFGASPGGASLAPDADYAAAVSAASVADLSGVGDFTLTELQKLLTAKAVSVSPFIGEIEEGFSGSSDPADLETALQLIYLYATQPRFAADGLEVYKEQMEAFLANRNLTPEAAVQDARRLALCGPSIRCNVLPLEEVEALTLETVEAQYQERLGDLGDMTFVFVGNFDEATLTALAQRYLGNLPASGRRETWQDAIPDQPVTAVEQDLFKGEGDRSTVEITYYGAYSPTLESDVQLLALQQLLDIRLREEIREARGGAYSPFAAFETQQRPDPIYRMRIGFTTDPKRVEELLPVVDELVAELSTEAASDLNMTKVKEQILRSHELELRENRYWLDTLGMAVYEPEMLTAPVDFAAIVAALTAEALRAAAGMYLSGDGRVQIVQYPAAAQP